ncbi:MAG: hypothetical protein QXH93_02200, partial [Conexivisphaerales archaeon]
ASRRHIACRDACKGNTDILKEATSRMMETIEPFSVESMSASKFSRRFLNNKLRTSIILLLNFKLVRIKIGNVMTIEYIDRN